MENRKTDILFKLGYKIRYERGKKGYSQEYLAEKADLNRNFVGMVERGESNITVKNLEKIAKALEIDIKVLFDFTF